VLTKEKLKQVKGLNKLDKILVYCNTGQRARRAVDIMREFGYKNVYYIEGTYKTLL
jgi:rhodanese-related sulfurtransferase